MFKALVEKLVYKARVQRLIRTKIFLLGRDYYYSYICRFALRVRNRSAKSAPNSEVHPNTTLAAGGMLAEALQIAEDACPGKYRPGGHRSHTRRFPPAQALKGATRCRRRPGGFHPLGRRRVCRPTCGGGTA